VFPTHKYRLIVESLRQSGDVAHGAVCEAPGAMLADMARVHSEDYLDDFLNCRNSWRTGRSELPLRPDVIGAYTHGAMATMVATDDAIASGRLGVNIGGGFHHCFSGHAEGFCYLNDVAIAIEAARAKGAITSAAIIDLDVHQGNGTAHIYQHDPAVFTFSMHQEDNYPPKQQSDLDVGLDDGVADEEYLNRLEECLTLVFTRHQPELVHYLAGADPYCDDKLGGLSLSMEGLLARDRMVFEECKRRGIPVVVTLAGGYARNTQDTVSIHCNTIRLAMSMFR
jgi:acetoin utilization deacetylase AcuC-like enzyme